MLLTHHYIKDAHLRFKRLSEKIEKQKDFSEEEILGFYNTFYTISLDVINALTEYDVAMDYYYKNNLLLTAKSLLLNEIKIIDDNVDNIEYLKRVLSSLDTHLGLDLPEKGYNSYYNYTWKNSFYNEYIDVSDSCMKALGRAIISPNNRNINALHLQPYGREKDLFNLTSNLPEVVLHAAHANINLKYHIKKNFNKIAWGSSKNSLISNNVFDIVYLHPKLDIVKETRMLFKPEKEVIEAANRYVRPNGYLVLAMPSYRYYKDICSLIAKNYDSIQLREAYIEQSPFKTIILIARRKTDTKDKTINPDIFKELRTLVTNTNLTEVLFNPFEPIRLPEEELDITYFRGNVLDEDELEEIYLRSTSTKMFWQQQQPSEDNNKKQPLLPFNLGQLGLVLTSGDLDGIIEEESGHKHIIKGRVIKSTEQQEDEIDEDKDTLETSEVSYNRVEINIFLGDGTHKILA